MGYEHAIIKKGAPKMALKGLLNLQALIMKNWLVHHFDNSLEIHSSATLVDNKSYTFMRDTRQLDEALPKSRIVIKEEASKEYIALFDFDVLVFSSCVFVFS